MAPGKALKRSTLQLPPFRAPALCSDMGGRYSKRGYDVWCHASGKQIGEDAIAEAE